MFKSIFLPLIAVASFIVLVGLLSQGRFDRFIKKPIDNTSKTISIEGTEIKIEEAKTNEERAKGLSDRESLDENSGMLFFFNPGSTPIFWMKDTKIPLDIIWISNNKIIGIEDNVQPEPNVPDNQLKKYPSPSKVDYVLELNGGFSKKKGIKVGQTISGLEQR